MIYYTGVQHIRPVGQEAKTPPSHGGNMGSIPVRVTRGHGVFRRGLFAFAASLDFTFSF